MYKPWHDDDSFCDDCRIEIELGERDEFSGRLDQDVDDTDTGEPGAQTK